MDKANANNKKLENALDYSLKLLNKGASIEECIRLYPNQRRELKELLEAAATVKSAYPGYPELRPSKLYAKTARAEFLSAIENGVPATPRPRVREAQTTKSNLFIINSFYRKALLSSAAAAAAIVIAAGGLVYASGDSMPGSPLYGLKRATEKARLAVTFNEESRAKLHYGLAQKRIDEAKSMAKSGKDSEVAGISREAKESLAEAGKIAKVVPPVEKDKLTGEIDSLSGLAEALQDNQLGDGGNKLAARSGEEPKSDAERKVETEKKIDTAQDTTTTSKSDQARTDRPGEAASNVRRKYSASIGSFNVASINLSNNRFSPNNDGVKDTTRITIRGAESGEFNILLYRNSSEAAIIAQHLMDEDSEHQWDGRDIAGKKVPDGEYAIHIVGRDGRIAKQTPKVIIDTVAPTVQLIDPPNGIITQVQTPRFTWSTWGDADSSSISIEPGFAQGRSRYAHSINNDVYDVPTNEILEVGKWYWKVEVFDKAGNSSVSDTRQLVIGREKLAQ